MARGDPLLVSPACNVCDGLRISESESDDIEQILVAAMSAEISTDTGVLTERGKRFDHLIGVCRQYSERFFE
jgi:hypothetical protein